MTPSGGAPHDPWFRLGTLDVGTAVGIALLSGVAMFLSAVLGFGSPLIAALALDPDAVVHGEVWRLVTWPFAYVDGSRFLWDVLTIVMFWYFGRDLEDNLMGRKRLLNFCVTVTLIFSIVSVAIYAGTGEFVPDAGLGTVELVVLLAWIAEWPQRRFMFNIPAWVFGAVILGITLLSGLGSRSWGYLLYLVVGLLLCTIAARSFGLLSEHHALPTLHLPRRHKPRPARHEHGPRARRSHRHPSQGPTVVAGPWQGSGVPAESSDESRMNALLEKIHASGQDSLSGKEKKELLELRERLRRR